MNWHRRCALLILAAAIAALALRLPRLQQRPMHADEAVHAVKFGGLLEKGSYRYNPVEYHGPILNYLTLIPAWICDIQTYENLNEFTLRIVPVLSGVLLVLLILFMWDGLGPAAAVIAAGLTAISPAFVYYSRYYIQEMLLVCFTFGILTFGYRYYKDRRFIWAVLTGIFIGLSHATKETFIIFLGSIALTFLVIWLIWLHRETPGFKRLISLPDFIAMLVSAAVVSAIFYSSFFSNPSGIIDSFRTYVTYFSRASQNNVHIHPWYYYLKMLIYSQYDDGPLWSEGLIVVLAAAGFVFAVLGKSTEKTDKNLLRFIAVYTLIMTVVYSAVPYKTPWCLLGFLQGMILLAGVGVCGLFKLTSNRNVKIFTVVLLIAAGVHLTWQSCRACFIYYADYRNPYVYSHPTEDVITTAEKLKKIANVHPKKLAVPVQIICPEHDYWPFPWYFRGFSNVGYLQTVPEDFSPAPVIIVSPKLEDRLIEKIYEQPIEKREMYLWLFEDTMYLRPKSIIRCYVTKDLWEMYRQKAVQSSDNKNEG